MDDKLTNKDAITVLRSLQEWLYYSSMNGGTSIQREAIDIAIGALKQPEIIRCKDCKQFRRWIDTDICFCDITEAEMSDSDFCSKAERREE